MAKKLVEIGFEERDVVVLKTGETDDKRPTQSAIARRFADFVDNLNEGDFVIVYLSGHGLQSPTGEAFFAPTDVDLKDLFGTSVSIKEMTRALKKSAASFRWIIVDACREDPANPGAARSPFQLARSATARALTDPLDVPDSVLLLQSCEPGNLSYEGGRGRAKHLENGFFTLSLLEALDENKSKADANDDGVLAFSELFTYVSARTNEMAYEYYDATQKPCLDGLAADFALMTIGDVTPENRRKAKELYAAAQRLREEKKWEAALEKIREARECNPENEEYRVAEAEVEQVIAGSKPPVVIKDDDDGEKIDELKQMIAELQRNQTERPITTGPPISSERPITTGPPITGVDAASLNRMIELGLSSAKERKLDAAFLQLSDALRCYLAHLCQQSGDDATAVWILLQEAKRGFPLGWELLGECYYSGRGVPQDYAMAVYCFEQAAANGRPKAMWWLGICFCSGTGVVQNAPIGIEWIRRAARAGDNDAQIWLQQQGIAY
ncbi:MAG: caspase family protein [Thermoguttaceae bacterium]|nr:caspase family protein [Thermoguttaceae bacterium]